MAGSRISLVLGVILRDNDRRYLTFTYSYLTVRICHVCRVVFSSASAAFSCLSS